jgi:pimeloyl-ACP methyl ester carboxylesterase
VQVPVGAGLLLDAVDTGPANGPVALLLHGFPQSSWCWRGVWPVLASAGLHVVAPDQRGYSPGARPADVQDYRMAELVADSVAVLDALGPSARTSWATTGAPPSPGSSPAAPRTGCAP